MNEQNSNQDVSADLDRLLAEWHADNVEAARAGRDRVLDELQKDRPEIAGRLDHEVQASGRSKSNLIPGRGLLAAALFVLVAMLALLVVPGPQGTALAGVLQIPDGGRLEAFDAEGALIGPCPLQHTDVAAEVSGPIVSVSIAQRYANPYETPIEAVYTFPMSNRGAVHRMTMTIVDPDGNERIVEGEVKERKLARQMYEQARDAGYVASLLEQERPNIFTQSVANIAPGATVSVEIGYLEVIEARDGEYTFEFPTVVGPRYIPGVPSASSMPDLPPGVAVRRGIILRGPGGIVPFALPRDWSDFLQRPVQGFDGLTFQSWMEQKIASTPERFDSSMVEAWTPNRIFETMTRGVRIDRPAIAGTTIEPRTESMSSVVNGFVVYDTAPNDGKTRGTSSEEVVLENFTLYEGGYGEIDDRWFCWAPLDERSPGSNFSSDTDQVPDAGRITPMPVRPDQRAGHDISIDVRIDTGGVPIVGIEAPLHEVVEKRDGKGKVEVTLADRATIPNRDFVLRWRLADEAIAESVFTHVIPGDENEVVPGGYLTMVLSPPATVPSEGVRPRELVFVLDTSGSMRGFPIEKAKAVMTKAIDSMRPNDSFNLITFAGATRMLWNQPRPATPENRALANVFIESRQGGGGTEMMKAIDAALTRTVGNEVPMTADELKNLPADGRAVRVRIPFGSFAIRQLVSNPELGTHSGGIVSNRDDMDIKYAKPAPDRPAGVVSMTINGDTKVDLEGRWVIEDGRRVMRVDTATLVLDETAVFADDVSANADPMRIVIFMTDGYVGNDQAIVQAVRDHAKSTRVFALGVGNSVNRFLLDEMARQGRGAVDYVLLADGADAVVDRLTKRIQTPVLTDIEVKIEGVESYGILPANPEGLLPDLFDARPIMLHARYRPPTSGSVEGTVVITGNTGSGRYERRIPMTFARESSDHASIATLWGRAKVDEVLASHLAAVEAGVTPPAVEAEVVALGEAYSIVTSFTSFVAVERAKMTVKGRPMLVTVPIELPDGTDWVGFFGEDCPPAVRRRGLEMAGGLKPSTGDDLGESMVSSAPARSLDAAVREGNSRATRPGSMRESIPGKSLGGGGGGRVGALSGTGAGGGPASLGQAASGRKQVASVPDSKGRGRGRGSSSRDIPAPPMIGSTDFGIAGVDSPSGSMRDLDRIARTIDRRLILLALGAPASTLKGIPSFGLDGRSWIDESTVEITILLASKVMLSKTLIEELGLLIQGESTIVGARLVVARIGIDRLLDLGEIDIIRRVIPSTGS